jgi:hypothetical protein
MSIAQEFEFRVGQHVYRATPMSAFQQFEIARMLRNVLTGLALIEEEIVSENKRLAEEGKPSKPAPGPRAFVQLMCSMAGGLTKSESAESTSLCLASVQRQVGAGQGVGWSPIQIAPGQLAYEDVDMSQMLEIVWHVLRSNGLIAFFSVSPSSSATTEPAAPRDGRDSRIRETGSSARHSTASAAGRS